jgi:hypothetical protein
MRPLLRRHPPQRRRAQPHAARPAAPRPRRPAPSRPRPRPRPLRPAGPFLAEHREMRLGRQAVDALAIPAPPEAVFRSWLCSRQGEPPVPPAPVHKKPRPFAALHRGSTAPFGHAGREPPPGATYRPRASDSLWSLFRPGRWRSSAGRPAGRPRQHFQGDGGHLKDAALLLGRKGLPWLPAGHCGHEMGNVRASADNGSPEGGAVDTALGARQIWCRVCRIHRDLRDDRLHGRRQVLPGQSHRGWNGKALQVLLAELVEQGRGEARYLIEGGAAGGPGARGLLLLRGLGLPPPPGAGSGAGEVNGTPQYEPFSATATGDLASCIHYTPPSSSS